MSYASLTTVWRNIDAGQRSPARELVSAKMRLDRPCDQSRVREMYRFEKRLRENHRYIAGVDEVGRGPMAGPVVAAAVILPSSPEIPGVNDSKKLSAQKREAIFDLILSGCLAYGIGVRSARFVDENAIVEGVSPQPCFGRRLSDKGAYDTPRGRRQGRFALRLSRFGVHHRQGDPGPDDG